MLTPRLLLSRLWHQLTVKLFELLNDSSFSEMDCLAFYTDFISHFEAKLNQVIFFYIVKGLALSFTWRFKASGSHSDRCFVWHSSKIMKLEPTCFCGLATAS